MDLYNLVGRISLAGFEGIAPRLTQINNQFNQLNININNTTRNINNVTNNTKSFTQKLSSFANRLGSSLQSAGAKITSIGTKLTAGVTLPIVGLGVAALKTSADFEQGMAKVQATSGASGEDLEKLKNKAKEMGIATKFSAIQSAEALNYMAMA